jgi:putative hydrolase of the HAD superfamily
MIKGIIFDWGETLWDNKNDQLFLDAKEILEYLKQKGYKMSILSRIQPESGIWHEIFEGRHKRIRDSGLESYFDKVLVSTKKEREEIYSINELWNFDYQSILSIGDQVKVDVKLANKLGMQSVWIKKGNFEEELPTKETGNPTYIISTLSELQLIL